MPSACLKASSACSSAACARACVCLRCAGEGVGRREELWRPRKHSESAAPEEEAHEKE